MTLAILIQDDLVQSAANEIKGIADFIRRLPPGSRVMVAYLRSGVIQVRQKFTGDLERAAKSLRIPVSSSSFAPYSPFDSTREALTRFASQPVRLDARGAHALRLAARRTPRRAAHQRRHRHLARRRRLCARQRLRPPARHPRGAAPRRGRL